MNKVIKIWFRIKNIFIYNGKCDKNVEYFKDEGMKNWYIKRQKDLKHDTFNIVKDNWFGDIFNK